LSYDVELLQDPGLAAAPGAFKADNRTALGIDLHQHVKQIASKSAALKAVYALSRIDAQTYPSARHVAAQGLTTSNPVNWKSRSLRVAMVR
jgi:hypothetical protein